MIKHDRTCYEGMKLGDFVDAANRALSGDTAQVRVEVRSLAESSEMT
jgi:hypothetical protein